MLLFFFVQKGREEVHTLTTVPNYDIFSWQMTPVGAFFMSAYKGEKV